MMQKKKILYKILYAVLILAIVYNFLYLANTLVTRKEYLQFFETSFIPLKGLVIVRGRTIATASRR